MNSSRTLRLPADRHSQPSDGLTQAPKTPQARPAASKGSASQVTVSVPTHARPRAQPMEDVGILFMACLLLCRQVRTCHEAIQLVGSLLLQCGGSGGAVAPAKRLRLERARAERAVGH